MGGRGVGVFEQHPKHLNETPPSMPPQLAMMMNLADPSILNKIFAQSNSICLALLVHRETIDYINKRFRLRKGRGGGQLDKCLDMLMQQQQPMNGRVSNSSAAMNNGFGGVRAVGLEDLERSINSNNIVRADEFESQAHKGNPLQDPNQQAHLMNCLNKLSKQQGEILSQPLQHLLNGGHARHQQSSSPPPQLPGGVNGSPM